MQQLTGDKMNNLHPDFKTLIENVFSPAAVAQTAADIEDLEREAELIKAQIDHQNEFMGMNFFPLDGRCHQCRANLADIIPEEKLRNENITGCPSCNSTFVG